MGDRGAGNGLMGRYWGGLRPPTGQCATGGPGTPGVVLAPPHSLLGPYRPPVSPDGLPVPLRGLGEVANKVGAPFILRRYRTAAHLYVLDQVPRQEAYLEGRVPPVRLVTLATEVVLPSGHAKHPPLVLPRATVLSNDLSAGVRDLPFPAPRPHPRVLSFPSHVQTPVPTSLAQPLGAHPQCSQPATARTRGTRGIVSRTALAAPQWGKD